MRMSLSFAPYLWGWKKSKYVYQVEVLVLCASCQEALQISSPPPVLYFPLITHFPGQIQELVIQRVCSAKSDRGQINWEKRKQLSPSPSTTLYNSS